MIRTNRYRRDVFVKIEGMTNEADALLAVAMGADAVGFVFAPSPRQIAPGIASDIVKRLPPEVMTVGVFRDEAPARVVEIVNTVGLRAAQLHGHETADQARWVRERVPFLFQAFPAGAPAVARAADYGADVIILDAPQPRLRADLRLDAGRGPRRAAPDAGRRPHARQRDRGHRPGPPVGGRRGQRRGEVAGRRRIRSRCGRSSRRPSRRRSPSTRRPPPPPSTRTISR